MIVAREESGSVWGAPQPGHRRMVCGWRCRGCTVAMGYVDVPEAECDGSDRERDATQELRDKRDADAKAHQATCPNAIARDELIIIGLHEEKPEPA